MQRKHFTVLTKNGNDYDWEFTENIGTDDYGNKTYIHVEMPSGDVTLIDCRYMTNYDFVATCNDALNEFYGENLVRLIDHDNYNVCYCNAFTHTNKEGYKWMFVQSKEDTTILECIGPERSLLEILPSQGYTSSELTLYYNDFLANYYGTDFVCAVISKKGI